jgi:hypothetical protein
MGVISFKKIVIFGLLGFVGIPIDVWADITFDDGSSEISFAVTDSDLFELPSDLKTILDDYAHELAAFRSHHSCGEPQKFSWLPGFLVKVVDVHGRIEGLKICLKVLEKYKDKLDLVQVPKKYCYYNANDNNVYLIAEEIPGYVVGKRSYDKKVVGASFIRRLIGLFISPENSLLTVDQMRQLSKFIMKAGWWDARRDNFVVTFDGKIVIIDTQEMAFDRKGTLGRRHNGLNSLTRLTMSDQVGYLEQDALEYLKKKIEHERQNLVEKEELGYA